MFLLKIKLPFQVSALNEATPGSVKSVFKAWEERLNSSGVITHSAIHFTCYLFFFSEWIYLSLPVLRVNVSAF